MNERMAGNWWNIAKTKVVGKLVGYLCTTCGYYETYVEDAQGIDWDQVEGFAWLNTSADQGPYR